MSRRFGPWCCALLLFLACVPSETDDDSIPEFDARTTLAGKIQRRGTLVVGVEENFPPLASTSNGTPEGFTVEIGRWIADGLGVEAEIVTGSTTELTQMVTDNEVDVAFPMVPITEAALDKHLFSAPYFEGHQRVLAPADSGITGVGDLGGQRICSFVDSTGVDVEELNPDAEVVSAGSPAPCLTMLEDGEVDGVTAPDIVLISLVARSTEDLVIVGDDLSTAGYGAMVRRNPLGLNSFIDSVLGEAEEEGRWNDLYARWIAPESKVTDVAPPELTLESAAAINPGR